MIYIVEDDESIRELVVYTLQTTGLESLGLSCGTALYEALQKSTPHLILLDIMLPGDSGIDILKKLRGDFKTRSIPVIMLTAKGSEFDKVVGLDSGADDYITKPFGMMELVSRVKAMLRRTGADTAPQGVVHAGGVMVDRGRHTVHANGQLVELTHKEFELLCRLMDARGLVLTRDSLLENIWGYDFDGETRTVDVHIRTLRQKLGDSGNIIETVRGVGYRMGGVNES